MSVRASACGKAILFGEHAVVYGQPALAVPLPSLRAYAEVVEPPPKHGIIIEAVDVGRRITYPSGTEAKDLLSHGLRLTIMNTLAALGVQEIPALTIRLSAQLPQARGLGSGTAVTAALVRALAAYLGKTMPTELLSELVYQTEIVYHGHPSGIDNTVIAWERPVYYQRERPLQLLENLPAFHLVIADSGIASHTIQAVEQVRAAWQAQPARYEALFTQIGQLTADGLRALEAGNLALVGNLMNANQKLLREIGVSSAEIEHLTATALSAGALGAKLSGGGLGGCIIALVEKDSAMPVCQVLRREAHQVWLVEVHDANRD